MAGFASRAAIASASLQLLFKKLCDRVDARNVGDFGGRLVFVLNRVKDFLPKNLYVFGSLNANLDLVAANFDYGKGDVLANLDFFVGFSGKD
jgi:hypothetical protein